MQVPSATSLSGSENSIGARDMTSQDSVLVLEPLTHDDVERLMNQPNGSHLLLEYCRQGLVDPEEAARAIDRHQNTPRKVIKRFFVAVVESVLGR
jgi:hypothetical protein